MGINGLLTTGPVIDEMDRLTDAVALAKIRIYDRDLLTGLCLFEKSLTRLGLQEALVELIDGWEGHRTSVSRRNNDVIPSGEATALEGRDAFVAAQEQGMPLADLADQNALSRIMRREMSGAKQSRVPCSLLCFSFQFTLARDDISAQVINTQLLQPLINLLTEDVLPHEHFGHFQRADHGGGANSIDVGENMAVSFFLVLPSSGIYLARKRAGTIRTLLGRIELQAHEIIKNCMLSVGVGVYHGTTISVDHFIEGVAEQLILSAANDGATCVLPGSANQSCQVTVEERNKLFCLMK